jgi:3-oxoacyl-[acyl-carrier protein] reductase
VNGRDAAVLERTAEEIRAATGAEVVPVAADVATPDGQAALLAAAGPGGPDILVTNNAGRRSPTSARSTASGRSKAWSAT